VGISPWPVLADYLIECKPKYLLIDELDKLSLRDYAVLLSLCETGRVVEVLYGRRREAMLKTIVFAAANRRRDIPPEVLSRFEVLEFPEYTREEFIRVCVGVLQRREGVEEERAWRIAKAVCDRLDSRDVREAIRIARLTDDREEVDEVVETLRRYRPRKGFKGRGQPLTG